MKILPKYFVCVDIGGFTLVLSSLHHRFLTEKCATKDKGWFTNEGWKEQTMIIVLK